MKTADLVCSVQEHIRRSRTACIYGLETDKKANMQGVLKLMQILDAFELSCEEENALDEVISYPQFFELLQAAIEMVRQIDGDILH